MYIIRCWLKRLAVPEHLSRPSEVILQILSVSSEKPMRLVIFTVLQLAHLLAHTHTHTYCMHTIQSVTRDIVVESVSGLTIAIEQADLHVYNHLNG